MREKYILIQTDSLQIDSLSLVPHSLIVQGIDSNAYFLDWSKSILYWKTKPSIDSVKISYRVFPNTFASTYFHKDLRLMETNLNLRPYYYDGNQAQNNQPFIDFGNINYAGSFGRALSFGNSQDVVLNSQFNLQLEGNIGDSIQLIGSITDNTIPFQPEGNTQQLQEFDRVFLQFKRKKSTLIAGDYDIRKPPSYFMNFYKRVQGGFVSSAYNLGKTGEQHTSVGVSLAKGKFVRNTLKALEGNQGPYKLTGPNGEQYFVILAGTERVYIDGIQMNRGEDQDYVIDYNTAEIIFMPKRLITKDLRIVAEFEFSDRNYINSLIYVHHDWQPTTKLQIRLDAYANQDSKNQPVQQDLDSTQKRFLATIGDSIQQAFYPSVKYQDTFQVGKILFKKIDTLVLGTLYTNVYVYSTNPDSAKYELNFSFVGSGNGNYRQSINSANGRVYAWVAPENGIRQGDYEPVIVLVTPKKQHMFTLGSTYKIDSSKNIQAEIALSDYDPNTFSRIDNEQHIGLASKIQYDEKRFLNRKHQLILYSKANYEYVQAKFKAIERFRNVEFTRDWNINSSDKPENEHLGDASFLLEMKDKGNLGYKFATYYRGNTFRGNQHNIQFNTQLKSYQIIVKNDLMKQESILSKSTFYRPFIQLEKAIKHLNQLTLGTRFLLEHNKLIDKQTDTLSKGAFSFDATSIYLKNNPTASNTFQAEYTLRHDRAATKNEFKPTTLGNTFSLSSNISSIKNQQIRGTVAYRILSIQDTNLTTLKPDESLLGRIEYDFSFWKGLVAGNLLYEFGSGQELKREYAYVEVPIGQGLYVWRDYNQDNVQQLNEFELAIFPNEKKFIKVLTPTNQYVKAKYGIYNQTISLNPKSIFNNTQIYGLKKLISIFYLQSAIQLNNRFIGKEGLTQYNPFVRVLDDSLLINNTSSWINSVILNRFSNQWGLDYIQTTNTNKTLLNYGIDARKNNEHLLRSRYNLTKQFTLGISGKYGKKIFNSQFLESRSYQIKYWATDPGFTFLFKKNQCRVQCNYKYDLRKNIPALGGEKAAIHSINTDIKYNIINSGSINLRSIFSSIQYNGIVNSGLGYTMLDGLAPGKNWQWQVSFEKRISKSIEMSIEYEGRKPATNPAVHTGRASIRAIF